VEELQAVLAETPSRTSGFMQSGAIAPDFQNERVKVYIGRLPPPEAVKQMLDAAAERSAERKQGR
jgi:hypothetical protein